MSQVTQAPERYKELPFEVLDYSETEELRRFDSKLQDEETQWHRDAEDRWVEAELCAGWLIQLEDQMPVPMVPGKCYFIPAESWHRAIKVPGASDLIVRIRKGVKPDKM